MSQVVDYAIVIRARAPMRVSRLPVFGANRGCVDDAVVASEKEHVYSVRILECTI